MQPIEKAILEHEPVKIYALFSGGDDSLASTHFAMEHGAHEVAHISTGIGVDEKPGLSVIEFVSETCKKYGWPWRPWKPPELSYKEMVLKFGFPGPGAHAYPYSWLKERCVRAMVREAKHKWKDRIGLCTGVRVSESARRMGYVEPIIRVGAQVWIAPFFDRDKIFVLEYLKYHRIERSPVVRLIGMSGECFCGAFAKPKEFENKIKPNFPLLAEKIECLQRQARELGVRDWKWGIRPRRNPKNYDLPFMPLYVNCHGGAIAIKK
jgi:3'-phosphoadenosine 5'-phosphosulfate sulfotransferase (PAPS reductase)/FAD synthetase